MFPANVPRRISRLMYPRCDRLGRERMWNVRERTVDTRRSGRSRALRRVDTVADALQNGSRGGQPRNERRTGPPPQLVRRHVRWKRGSNGSRRAGLPSTPFLYFLSALSSPSRVPAAPRRAESSLVNQFGRRTKPGPRIVRGVNEPRNGQSSVRRPH